MIAIAVLLGQGIDYSASPAVRNAAFAALGLDARYELRDDGVDGLADDVDDLRMGGRTDREAPIDVMREAMRRELGPAADG